MSSSSLSLSVMVVPRPRQDVVCPIAVHSFYPLHAPRANSRCLNRRANRVLNAGGPICRLSRAGGNPNPRLPSHPDPKEALPLPYTPTLDQFCVLRIKTRLPWPEPLAILPCRSDRIYVLYKLCGKEASKKMGMPREYCRWRNEVLYILKSRQDSQFPTSRGRAGILPANPEVPEVSEIDRKCDLSTEAANGHPHRPTTQTRLSQVHMSHRRQWGKNPKRQGMAGNGRDFHTPDTTPGLVSDLRRRSWAPFSGAPEVWPRDPSSPRENVDATPGLACTTHSTVPASPTKGGRKFD